MKLRLSSFLKSVMIGAAAFVAGVPDLAACTSMIVSGKSSLSGRPMLWKHRDTGADHNFLARVEADPSRPGSIGYVGLFNGGDTALREAWMGMNDAGFAIMNTASYNLAPDTAGYKDREGMVMSEALRSCHTVDDFENLLMRLPKPLGVQANFGVLDATGAGAYFETDDYSYTKFPLEDSPSGVMIRTNYSFSGDDSGGYGYIRYDNVEEILGDRIVSRSLIPACFTEEMSRCFYNSRLGYNPDTLGDSWTVDQDFVPRSISTASIVIEGLLPGELPEAMVMWTALGYPPCSHVEPVFLDSIPDDLQALGPERRSVACDRAMELKEKVFPIVRGSGPRYINLDALRPIMDEERQKSLDGYRRGNVARTARLKKQ